MPAAGRETLLVVNVAWFFQSHRLAVAPDGDGGGLQRAPGERRRGSDEIIEAQKTGIEFHRLEMTRGGTNPMYDVQSLQRLKRTMRGLRPHIVHIQPGIFGQMWTDFRVFGPVVWGAAPELAR
jgi:hypothetical protein